jgi:hypothetical protein
MFRETSEIVFTSEMNEGYGSICRGLLCRQAEAAIGLLYTGNMNSYGKVWSYSIFYIRVVFDSAYSTDLRMNLLQIQIQYCEASHSTGTEMYSHILSNSMEKLTVALLVKKSAVFM